MSRRCGTLNAMFAAVEDSADGPDDGLDARA